MKLDTFGRMVGESQGWEPFAALGAAFAILGFGNYLASRLERYMHEDRAYFYAVMLTVELVGAIFTTGMRCSGEL